jgi:rhamnose transport system permease protein
MTRLTALLARWETFLLLVLAATLIAGPAMPISIVALPMTLIFITGEIDISVGSMIGLCATIIALATEAGFSAPLAIAAGVAVGALAGLVNGAFVVFGALPSLVVTIGTLALYRGIAQILLQERGVSDFPD